MEEESNNGVLSTVSTAAGPLDTHVNMVPPISGNRALSNHLMWRSANRHGFVNRADFASVPDATAIDVEDDSGERAAYKGER